MSNLIKNFVFFANDDNNDDDNMINIRTIIDPNNEPYFVARDIATALGYENTKKAVSDHCFNPISVADFVNTLQSQGTRPVTPIEINSLHMQTKLIREPDVYALIFRSKLESAKRFQLWIFEEVLPEIRKTGSYIGAQIAQQVTIPQSILNVLLENNEAMLEELKLIRNVLVPKGTAYDLIAKTQDEYSISEAAKILNQSLRLTNTRHELSNQKLFDFLRAGKYVFGKRDEPKQNYVNDGIFVKKFTGGYNTVFSSTLITAKGLLWIIGPLKTAGLLPIAFDYDQLTPTINCIKSSTLIDSLNPQVVNNKMLSSLNSGLTNYPLDSGLLNNSMGSATIDLISNAIN